MLYIILFNHSVNIKLILTGNTYDYWMQNKITECSRIPSMNALVAAHSSKKIKSIYCNTFLIINFGKKFKLYLNHSWDSK